VKAASVVAKSLPCVLKATSPLALAVKAYQTVAVGPKQLVPGRLPRCRGGLHRALTVVERSVENVTAPEMSSLVGAFAYAGDARRMNNFLTLISSRDR